jgi:hypothetical protein
MGIYSIISPIQTSYDSPNIKTAVKNFIKNNSVERYCNIIILGDGAKYNAEVDYLNSLKKNNVKIKIKKDPSYVMYPSDSPIKPLYQANYDTSSPDIVGNILPIGGPNILPIGGPNILPIGGPNILPISGPSLGLPNIVPLDGPNRLALTGPSFSMPNIIRNIRNSSYYEPLLSNISNSNFYDLLKKLS